MELNSEWLAAENIALQLFYYVPCMCCLRA